MLLLSACNGDSQLQQRASQEKKDLDKLITHAQNIGVPNSLLKPIIAQENALSQTNEPISLFSAQPDNDYQQNLAKSYKRLLVQVRGLETQETQQTTYQASKDLQVFGDVLGQYQARNFVEAKTFADQLAHDQTLMAQGQYPKQFLQISSDAEDGTLALHLMGSTYDKYTSLQNALQQIQKSNLDTTAFDEQAQNDLQLFRKAKNSSDFSSLSQQLDAQMQGLTTLTTQAIPYVGAAKLQSFSDIIEQMKKAAIDVQPYQQRFDADKTALNSATSLNDYMTFSAQVDKDIEATRIPLLQGQATQLLQHFHQMVKDWGDTHQWLDPYDGKSYRLGYEYDQQGIGSDADAFLQAAQTPDDYQAVIDLANHDIYNLQQMEADSQDTTPWDQVHATDTNLLQYYKVTTGQVIVVSLAEQALRLYQDGHLVKAFLITSGQYEKPSLPGFWGIIDRESPTKFVSSAPKGSAFWYPDTKINYAMGYHSDGYFLHDSWWRVDYGPHTNFPHHDSGGDDSFAGTGSHGCINMQKDDAGWLYNNTSYNTSVIIY